MHAALLPTAAALSILLVAACKSEEGSVSSPRTSSETAAPAPSTGLVGRWEPTEQSYGGISALLEIHEDGTCISGHAVQVGMTYSLKGSRLSVALRSSEKVADIPEVDVVFDGDRMSRPDWPTMTRIGSALAGSSPIVGVWTYEHPTGGRAFERYADDGTMDLRIAMPGEKNGTYSVTGDTLTIEMDGKSIDSSFVLAGDLLTLTPASGGRSRTLRRTTAWYEFPLSAADLEKLNAKVRAKTGIQLPSGGK